MCTYGVSTCAGTPYTESTYMYIGHMFIIVEVLFSLIFFNQAFSRAVLIGIKYNCRTVTKTQTVVLAHSLCVSNIPCAHPPPRNEFVLN